jgi:hypothetical protein
LKAGGSKTMSTKKYKLIILAGMLITANAAGVWAAEAKELEKSAVNMAEESKKTNVGGFDVSLAIRSIPMKWSYLERTNKQALIDYGWGWSYLSTLDSKYTAKEENFRLLNTELRVSKKQQLAKNISAGVEIGLPLSSTEKSFSFGGDQIQKGSTVTVNQPQGLFELTASSAGPVSGSVDLSVLAFPVMANVDFSLPVMERVSLSAGAGVGAYIFVMKQKLTQTTVERWPTTGKLSSFSRQDYFVSAVPAGEFSLKGKVKLLKCLYAHLGADIALTGTAKSSGSGENTEFLSPEFGAESQSLTYKTGIETGGLIYGGRLGLELVF